MKNVLMRDLWSFQFAGLANFNGVKWKLLHRNLIFHEFHVDVIFYHGYMFKM